MRDIYSEFRDGYFSESDILAERGCGWIVTYPDGGREFFIRPEELEGLTSKADIKFICPDN